MKTAKIVNILKTGQVKAIVDGEKYARQINGVTGNPSVGQTMLVLLDDDFAYYADFVSY